jgi:phosphate transport system protein
MENRLGGQHISHEFDEELEDIRNRVLAMGGEVERQLSQAIDAFVNGDQLLAEKVLLEDDIVDALEMQIHNECVKVIAKRQPAAIDLRMVISIIKIIGDLERIGDESSRIAKMTIRLKGTDYNNEHYHEISHLVDMVKVMLSRCLDAFARLDVSSVQDIADKDEKVDREHVSIIRQLITRMMENPRNITRTLDVLWTVRSLERIGDHSCNISEHVVYIVDGEDIRHNRNDNIEY